MPALPGDTAGRMPALPGDTAGRMPALPGRPALQGMPALPDDTAGRMPALPGGNGVLDDIEALTKPCKNRMISSKLPDAR